MVTVILFEEKTWLQLCYLKRRHGYSYAISREDMVTVMLFEEKTWLQLCYLKKRYGYSYSV